MSEILTNPTAAGPFACADPKDTLLADPVDVTNAFCDELLRSSQLAATVPSDGVAPSLALPDDQLSTLNKQLPASIQSILFSYDGPPSTQYDALSPPTTERHISPSSLQLSPTSDDLEGTVKPRSPSSEDKKTRASPPGRKPGRRASKVRDEQREKFLEKNRIAANKHRKRKKEFIQGLESRYGEQLNRKDQLKAEVSALRAQALDLQESLFNHAQCDNQPIQNYLNNRIGCMYARQPINGGNALPNSYLL
ncbi:predicted protein [Aspergillus terreus NIH2624]|jgi:hypothetical protein|uniref:BZIP domain-containing protein n=1 Tax=Aspergillus terreus (strain NIH 2624 / FGSC A1156) TaxID=341663 RepID=Q0CLL0_ASPTN|nr:uncharacterized protein ATEG_05424 [Aspergillus terreus NIH2624]EAU34493.1 predicted protein [Aspergillus terreus NIH2624]